MEGRRTCFSCFHSLLNFNFFFLIFPLLARAIGIFGTIIGAPFVRGKKFSDPMVPLRNGMIVTTIFVVIALYFLTTVTLGSIQLYYAALSGVIASIVIFLITPVAIPVTAVACDAVPTKFNVCV